MIKILIDTLGGDRSPQANIEGAIRAINEIDDLEVVFVGRQSDNEKLLESLSFDRSRVSFVDAQDEISCNDKPTDAIRYKTESSLFKCLDLLKNDESVGGLVSCGSTGAIVAGATLKVGRIRGVKRPALCPVMPTMTRGLVAVCDSGANVDCDATYLHQFALMGNLLMQKAYGIESPRVALLNVGTEEEKGDLIRKEVYPILKSDDRLNFVGNMESRDLLSGKYDLVVCDGFSGNVLIKSTEGACLEMLKLIKGVFTKNFKNKMGALLLKKDIYALKDFMDYNNYSGAVMLGSKKLIVKGHGSSKASSVYMSVKQAYTLVKSDLVGAISSAITETEV